MNSKVAKKIKESANWILCIGIGVSVMSGISMVALRYLIGILVFLLGLFSSWLSYLILYGFGQLIEYAEIIAKNISEIKSYNEDFKFNKDTSSEERTENT